MSSTMSCDNWSAHPWPVIKKNPDVVQAVLICAAMDFLSSSRPENEGERSIMGMTKLSSLVVFSPAASRASKYACAEEWASCHVVECVSVTVAMVSYGSFVFLRKALCLYSCCVVYSTHYVSVRRIQDNELLVAFSSEVSGETFVELPSWRWVSCPLVLCIQKFYPCQRHIDIPILARRILFIRHTIYREK